MYIGFHIKILYCLHLQILACLPKVMFALENDDKHLNYEVESNFSCLFLPIKPLKY